jgi:hypothetical protein
MSHALASNVVRRYKTGFSKKALLDLNQVPSADIYRAALMSNGKVYYFRIGANRKVTDSENDPMAWATGNSYRSFTGWEWRLGPDVLKGAEELVRKGIASKETCPLQWRANPLWPIGSIDEEKARHFEYRNKTNPDAKKWQSPNDVPDEGIYYDQIVFAKGFLDVNIHDKTIDLDQSWLEIMTRRPGELGKGKGKSYVIPSGDVAFTSNQVDLIKLTKHLLKADPRVTLDFKIINSERHRGKTIGTIIGEDRDVDVALTGRGRSGEIKPFYAYHGTSKSRWEIIQKMGLIPNKQGKAYYDLIPDFSDRNVYFSLGNEKAENYAVRQAIWDKSSAVVLKVLIKDTTRIVPDEDSMMGWYGLNNSYELTTENSNRHPRGTKVLFEKGHQVHLKEVLDCDHRGVYRKDDNYRAYFHEVYTGSHFRP